MCFKNDFRKNSRLLLPLQHNARNKSRLILNYNQYEN